VLCLMKVRMVVIFDFFQVVFKGNWRSVFLVWSSSLSL